MNLKVCIVCIPDGLSGRQAGGVVAYLATHKRLAGAVNTPLAPSTCRHIIKRLLELLVTCHAGPASISRHLPVREYRELEDTQAC